MVGYSATYEHFQAEQQFIQTSSLEKKPRTQRQSSKIFPLRSIGRKTKQNPPRAATHAPHLFAINRRLHSIA